MAPRAHARRAVEALLACACLSPPAVSAFQIDQSQSQTTLSKDVFLALRRTLCARPAAPIASTARPPHTTHARNPAARRAILHAHRIRRHYADMPAHSTIAGSSSPSSSPSASSSPSSSITGTRARSGGRPSSKPKSGAGDSPRRRRRPRMAAAAAARRRRRERRRTAQRRTAQRSRRRPRRPNRRPSRRRRRRVTDRPFLRVYILRVQGR